MRRLHTRTPTACTVMHTLLCCRTCLGHRAHCRWQWPGPGWRRRSLGGTAGGCLGAREERHYSDYTSLGSSFSLSINTNMHHRGCDVGLQARGFPWAEYRAGAVEHSAVLNTHQSARGCPWQSVGPLWAHVSRGGRGARGARVSPRARAATNRGGQPAGGTVQSSCGRVGEGDCIEPTVGARASRSLSEESMVMHTGMRSLWGTIAVSPEQLVHDAAPGRLY
jgi:hypothetical protein